MEMKIEFSENVAVLKHHTPSVLPRDTRNIGLSSSSSTRSKNHVHHPRLTGRRYCRIQGNDKVQPPMVARAAYVTVVAILISRRRSPRNQLSTVARIHPRRLSTVQRRFPREPMASRLQSPLITLERHASSGGGGGRALSPSLESIVCRHRIGGGMNFHCRCGWLASKKPESPARRHVRAVTSPSAETKVSKRVRHESEERKRRHPVDHAGWW